MISVYGKADEIFDILVTEFGTDETLALDCLDYAAGLYQAEIDPCTDEQKELAERIIVANGGTLDPLWITRLKPTEAVPHQGYKIGFRV